MTETILSYALQIFLLYIVGSFLVIIVGLIFNRSAYVKSDYESNHCSFEVALQLTYFSWFGLLLLLIAIYLMKYTRMLDNGDFDPSASFIKFFENRK